MFWESRDAARREIEGVLPNVTVAIGNLDEWETAVATRDPDEAAEAVLAAGVDVVIVKQGLGGVLGRSATERVIVPPYPVEVVNGLGAGDGFGGAVCHGLLADWPLTRTLRFANMAGAIVASRIECSSAMPFLEEVETASNASIVQ